MWEKKEETQTGDEQKKAMERGETGSRWEPEQKVGGECNGDSPGSDEIFFPHALLPKRFI